MRNSLKVLALILVCIVLSNCERDTIPAEKTTKRSLYGIFGAIVQYDSISKINHNFKRLISDKFSSNHTKSAGNLTSEVYGFSIDTSKVQLLSANAYKSYTFNVEREQYDYKVLENYVLTIFDNGDYTQMLISYPVLISDFSANPDVENASITYINDSGLLLKSDIQCPSTTEEIVAWDDGCVEINCTAGGDHSPAEIDECNGQPWQLPWEYCNGGWVVTGCTTSGGGGSTGDEDANDDSPYGDGAGHTNPNPDPNEEIAIMPLFGDNGVQDRVNDNLSEDSPYEVDVSAILDTISLPDVPNEPDSTKIAAEKFMCVYKKLTTSPTYKNLFIDIFGDAQSNLKVKFKITKGLTYIDAEGNVKPANGLFSGRNGYTIDPVSGNITNANMIIQVRQELLEKGSTVNILKTIIHESMHAYLSMQMLQCNPDKPFNFYDNIIFNDLLVAYYDTLCAENSNDHELIFNKMIPVFGNIIDEIGLSNLVSEKDLSNFRTFSLLNWDDFKAYYPLQGLHNTKAFKNTVNNNPIKLDLFDRYVTQSLLMDKNCK